MITFVRHGETDFNLYSICQGQLNTSLNKNGLLQAKEVAEKLKNEKFDLIFCSPLNRAFQTAEEIDKYHNLEIIIDNRLIERSKGNLEGCKHGQLSYNDFFSDPHKFLGEDENDVLKRVKDFVEELKKYRDKNLLIVSHGGVYRVFVKVLKSKKYLKGNVEKIHIDNCEVDQFEF